MYCIPGTGFRPKQDSDFIIFENPKPIVTNV